MFELEGNLNMTPATLSLYRGGCRPRQEAAGPGGGPMYSDACRVRGREETNFLITWVCLEQGTLLPHLACPPALVQNTSRLGGLKTLGGHPSAINQGGWALRVSGGLVLHHQKT